MTKQERDAWAAAYRVYDEFSPRIRQADDATGCQLLAAAGERLAASYRESDQGGKFILLAGLSVLEDVYRAARDHAENRPKSGQ